MRWIAIVSIIITAAAGTARAQDAKIVVTPSRVYEACKAKAVSTPESENCARAETAVWDKRLNAAYQKIMASPNWDPATKGLVRTAQRSWLAYRDAKCSAAGELEAEGGTLSRIVAGDCIATETALRASELEAALVTH